MYIEALFVAGVVLACGQYLGLSIDASTSTSPSQANAGRALIRVNEKATHEP